MGQEFKINDCGEIIREKLPKKRNVIFRVIIGIFGLVCYLLQRPLLNCLVMVPALSGLGGNGS